MDWTQIVIAAAATYGNSRDQRSQRRDEADMSIEMLERRMQLEEEQRQRDRERRGQEMDAWGGFGMGGNQSGGLWGSMGLGGLNTGGLNPQAFLQQQGRPRAQMPWGGG